MTGFQPFLFSSWFIKVYFQVIGLATPRAISFFKNSAMLLIRRNNNNNFEMIFHITHKRYVVAHD